MTKTQNPYKSKNPKRSPKTSNDLKRPQMTSKDENGKPVSKNVKSKYYLRGGNPNDDIPNNGRDLIEHAFSST